MIGRRLRVARGLIGEKPTRLEHLCFRALAEGAITESKAAELLGVPVHDLNRRMEAARRRRSRGT